MNIDVTPKYQDTCYNSPNVNNIKLQAMYPSAYAMYCTGLQKTRVYSCIDPNSVTQTHEIIITDFQPRTAVMCLFDVLNVAMSRQNQTLVFLLVRIPKFSSLSVQRTRAV